MVDTEFHKDENFYDTCLLYGLESLEVDDIDGVTVTFSSNSYDTCLLGLYLSLLFIAVDLREELAKDRYQSDKTHKDTDIVLFRGLQVSSF